MQREKHPFPSSTPSKTITFTKKKKKKADEDEYDFVIVCLAIQPQERVLLAVVEYLLLIRIDLRPELENVIISSQKGGKDVSFFTQDKSVIHKVGEECKFRLDEGITRVDETKTEQGDQVVTSNRQLVLTDGCSRGGVVRFNALCDRSLAVYQMGELSEWMKTGVNALQPLDRIKIRQISSS